MGLGLFLVPVLGGYLLLTGLHYTRYDILRKSGYHLFFQSAIAGYVLVGVARPMSCAPERRPVLGVGALWKSHVPFDYSGTVALSVLLGLVFPYVANRFYGKEEAERRAATENGAFIELIISESIERQKPIEISLKNGKSYIGFAFERKIAVSGESDIAIIPIRSGYRHKDTHELVLTTDYASVIQKCLKGNPVVPDLRYEDFRVVVPMSEVGSVRIFHPEVYEQFRPVEEPDGA